MSPSMLHALPVALLALLTPVLATSGPTAATSNFTVAAGWYAGWHAEAAPISSVLWSKYTHLTYAFATPAADNTVTLVDSDAALLPEFVAAAQSNNVKAGLSIGGWGGSQFYSSSVGSAANRSTFVKSVVGLIQQYNLDLVDFDWEFPGVQGIGCNTISSTPSDDTENLLAMLKELRATAAGSKVQISAAVSVNAWPQKDSGENSTIAQIATQLDWVVPMVYDLSINWTVGAARIQRAFPTSPLDDSCLSTTPGADSIGLSGNGSSSLAVVGRGSARSAFIAWSEAGMPRNQIVLGVPSYGHGFDVNTSTAYLSTSSKQLTPYPPYDTKKHSHGDAWDATGAWTDICGNEMGPGGTYEFFSLVNAGYLAANGTRNANVTGRWDECSLTPYIYDPALGAAGVLISYDDAESFTAKGSFIHANGLGGFSMWEVGGDPKGVLLDAILSAPANSSLTVTPSASPAASTAQIGGTSAAAPSPRTHAPWSWTVVLLLPLLSALHRYRL